MSSKVSPVGTMSNKGGSNVCKGRKKYCDVLCVITAVVFIAFIALAYETGIMFQVMGKYSSPSSNESIGNTQPTFFGVIPIAPVCSTQAYFDSTGNPVSCKVSACKCLPSK
jgi:hypothetical protein